MDLSILVIKGSQVETKFKDVSAPEDCFVLANGVDPGVMTPYAAFHLSLPCST